MFALASWLDKLRIGIPIKHFVLPSTSFGLSVPVLLVPPCRLVMPTFPMPTQMPSMLYPSQEVDLFFLDLERDFERDLDILLDLFLSLDFDLSFLLDLERDLLTLETGLLSFDLLLLLVDRDLLLLDLDPLLLERERLLFLPPDEDRFLLEYRLELLDLESFLRDLERDFFLDFFFSLLFLTLLSRDWLRLLPDSDDFDLDFLLLDFLFDLD